MVCWTFRFGFVIQRTNVYQTDFDTQRGFLVRISYEKVDFERLRCSIRTWTSQRVRFGGEREFLIPAPVDIIVRRDLEARSLAESGGPAAKDAMHAATT